MALTGQDGTQPPPPEPHAALAQSGDLFAPRLFAGAPSHRRHSRTVRLLRVLLPAIAVVLIAIMFGWSHLLPLIEAWRQPADAQVAPAYPASANPTEAALQAQQEVASPRFMGVGSDNLPYSVTADRALQNQDGQGMIVLDNPAAEMTLRDGHWLSLQAARGEFDRRAQTLLLLGGVQLFHDDGYSISTERVAIDLTAQTAAGTSPAEAHGPALAVQTQGFVIDIGQGLVRLQGPSTMILRGAP